MPTPSIEPGGYDEEVCTVTVWRDKKTGVVILEDWHDSNRQSHRFDGPAFVERDPSTGIVTKESWYQHGKYHREGAPAVINRDPKTGRIFWSEWYHNGEKIPNPKRAPARAKRRPADPSPP